MISFETIARLPIFVNGGDFISRSDDSRAHLPLIAEYAISAPLLEHPPELILSFWDDGDTIWDDGGTIWY